MRLKPINNMYNNKPPPDPAVDISAYTEYYRKSYWNVSGRSKDYVGLGTGNPNWQPYLPAIARAEENLRRPHILNSYGSTGGTFHSTYYLPLLKRMGIELPVSEDKASQCMTPGNGVTQLYTAAVNSLLGEDDILLMPVPTYGYFLKTENLSHTHVKPLALPYENGFRLTPEILDECIEKTNKEMSPKRVTAFLNINPHNPTGIIYEADEIRAFAKVLQKHGIKLVIDDMVYAGLEFRRATYDPASGNEKEKKELAQSLPVPFAAIDGMFDKTITLFGLSKAYNLPGLRAGLAVGPKNLIAPVRKYIGDNVEFISPIAQAAMTEVFGEDEDNTRTLYLHQQALHFFKRCYGLRAMLNGIDDPLVRCLPGITPLEVANMLCEDQMFVQEALKETDKNSFDLLHTRNMIYKQVRNGGIKGVDLACDPWAGFFVILDLTSLKGKYYGSQKIESGIDLVKALISCSNVDSLPGESMGYYGDRILLRISTSADVDKMVKGMMGINDLVERVQDHPFDLPKTRGRTMG